MNTWTVNSSTLNPGYAMCLDFIAIASDCNEGKQLALQLTDSSTEWHNACVLKRLVASKIPQQTDWNAACEGQSIMLQQVFITHKFESH